MVGMEMREEDRLDPAVGDAHQRDVLGPALARIDHEDVFAGDHHGARPRARRIGQRRAGAAQGDVEAVGQVARCYRRPAR